MSKDCWLKEENKDKRPKGWKPPKATGTEQATPDGGGKYLLNALSFPNDPLLLTDPNVWIADTAATGVQNLSTAKDDNTITMGNKQIEKKTEFGDIPVGVCDKEGNDVIRTVMKNVAICLTVVTTCSA
jgi:hypothetical protein